MMPNIECLFGLLFYLVKYKANVLILSDAKEHKKASKIIKMEEKCSVYRKFKTLQLSLFNFRVFNSWG